MKRVIIDTDGQSDDSMALLLALKSKEINVEAITTTPGIRSLDHVTMDVLNIIELLDRGDIPVAKGVEKRFSRDMTPILKRTEEIWKAAGRPDSRPLRTPKAKPVKGYGVDLIIKKIMDNPGEIILVTLGALTNVAVALLIEPRIAEKVKEAYTMGGAVLTHGNATPIAEANIYGDPEAAKIFFNSGIPITLVDLYTFQKPILTDEQWTMINTNPAAKYTSENFEPWIEVLKKRRPEVKGRGTGDALTIGILIDRRLVETKKIFVDVETQGQLTSGQTIAYGLHPPLHPPPKEPNTELCAEVDAKRYTDLFIDRVTK